MNFVVWHNKGRASQHRLLVTIETLYQRAYRSRVSDSAIPSQEIGGYDDREPGKNQVVTMAMIQYLPGIFKTGFSFQNVAEYDMQDKAKGEKLALRRAIASVMADYVIVDKGYKFIASAIRLMKMVDDRPFQKEIGERVVEGLADISARVWFPNDSDAELEALSLEIFSEYYLTIGETEKAQPILARNALVQSRCNERDAAMALQKIAEKEADKAQAQAKHQERVMKRAIRENAGKVSEGRLAEIFSAMNHLRESIESGKIQIPLAGGSWAYSAPHNTGDASGPKNPGRIFGGWDAAIENMHRDVNQIAKDALDKAARTPETDEPDNIENPEDINPSGEF